MRLFSKELLLYDKNYNKADWQTVNTTVTGESIASRTFLESFVFCNDKFRGIYKNISNSLGSVNSDNGIDWTTFRTFGQLNGVTIYDMEVYNDGLTDKIIAVGKNSSNNPIITTSSGEILWGTPQKITAWSSIPETIANLKGLLYVVEGGSVSHTVSKTNISNWSTMTSCADLDGTGAKLLCAGKNKLVAIGTRPASKNKLYVSSNGTDWENIGRLPSVYLSQIDEWICMCFDGKKYIAIGLNGIYTISHDLQNWTSIKTIEDFSTNSLTRVKAGNGKILLFNCDGTTPLTEITYAEI